MIVAGRPLRVTFLALQRHFSKLHNGLMCMTLFQPLDDFIPAVEFGDSHPEPARSSSEFLLTPPYFRLTVPSRIILKAEHDRFHH
jgi:hypothetical protein